MRNHRNFQDAVWLQKDAKQQQFIALSIDQHCVREAVKRDCGARLERQRSVGLVDGHWRRRRSVAALRKAAAAVMRAATVVPHGSRH